MHEIVFLSIFFFGGGAIICFFRYIYNISRL